MNSTPPFVPLEALPGCDRRVDAVVAFRADVPLRWGALLDAAAAWRATFERRGIERAALYFGEAWELAGALMGAWAAGVAPSLTGDTLPATCAELSPHVDAFIGAFPEGLSRPRLSEPEHAASGGLGTWAPGAALSLFTSGSTGEHQAISKRLDQLAAEVSCLERTFGGALAGTTLVATVSHQHIYGLLFKLLWPLCAGRPFVSRTLFYPEELVAIAQRHGPVALVSSPAHLKRLPPELEWGAASGRWRAAFSSGGPLPIDAGLLTQRLLGTPAYEVFGSTETGGIAWRTSGSTIGAWRAFDDVRLRVEPPDGLLAVRSPKLAGSDWLTTADRAELDAQGTLRLLGRRDRIVKIEGKRISLTAVERALLESGWVLEAALVPLESDREGLGAVVRLNEAGLALDPRALRSGLAAAVAARVERVGVPRQFRVVSALPVDAQGKTTLAQLRELFAMKPSLTTLPEVLSIEQPAEHLRVLHLRIPAELRQFQGHFPEAPVLPGVVQVDWAQHFGVEAFAVQGAFRGLESVKFRRVIQAEDRVALELEYAPERGRLKFQYRVESALHASGVLLFG